MPEMNLRFAVIAAVIGSLALVERADAAILAGYTFDGGTAASTSIDPALTASLFQDGDGTLNVAGLVGNPAPSAFKSYTDLPTGSFSSTSWLGFSITPIAGHAVSLSSFGFDAQRDQVTGAGGNPASNAQVALQLAYSFDGTNFVDTGSPLALTANSGAWTSAAIDLTSVLSLQNAANQIWFRLSGHDAGRTSDTLGLHVDNVALVGRAAELPEPSSMVLLSLGACVLGSMIRRDRHPARTAA